MPYCYNEERLQQAITMLIEDEGENASFLSGRFAAEEHYKYDVFKTANEKLNWHSWLLSDIGTGRIL